MRVGAAWCGWCGEMTKRFGLLIGIPVAIGLAIVFVVLFTQIRSGTPGPSAPSGSSTSTAGGSGSTSSPADLPLVQPAFLEPGSGRVGFGAFNKGGTLDVAHSASPAHRVDPTADEGRAAACSAPPAQRVFFAPMNLAVTTWYFV